MDETSLRALFERAVADRPPTPLLVPNSVRAGAKLRKRRRLEAVVGSFAAIALIAAVVPAAAGVFGPTARPTAAVGGASGTAYVWLTGRQYCHPRPPEHRLHARGTEVPRPDPGRRRGAGRQSRLCLQHPAATQSTGQSQTGTGFVTAINNATGKAGRPIRLPAVATPLMTSTQIAPNGKLAYATTASGPHSNRQHARSDQPGNRRPARLASSLQQRDPTPPGVRSRRPDRITRPESNIRSGRSRSDTGTALPSVKLRAPGASTALRSRPTAGPPTRRARKPDNDRTTWLTPIDTGTNIAAKPIEVRFGPALPPRCIITCAGRPDRICDRHGPGVQPIRPGAGRALSRSRSQASSIPSRSPRPAKLAMRGSFCGHMMFSFSTCFRRLASEGRVAR